MSAIDLRKCINALSDVITNRPAPLRIFDQIYMKLADMLLHVEFLCRRFQGRSVVFVGDGDAIALSLVHLANLQLLPGGPKDVTVLDFDERVVNSINHFARNYEVAARIRAELYNVADALPKCHWQTHDAFHTNPPWGASNGGASVRTFFARGVECLGAHGIGCIVIGDHPDYPWTRKVQSSIQKYAIENGFHLAEMLPEFHHYHLDDDPSLTSCSMVVRRSDHATSPFASVPTAREDREHFMGGTRPSSSDSFAI